MEICIYCDGKYEFDGELENYTACSECFEKIYAHCYVCCENVKICSSNCDKCKCFECKKIFCQNCTYVITHDKYVCMGCYYNDRGRWTDERE